MWMKFRHDGKCLECGEHVRKGEEGQYIPGKGIICEPCCVELGLDFDEENES